MLPYILYGLGGLVTLAFIMGAMRLAGRSSDLADYERAVTAGDRRLSDVLTEHSGGVNN